MRRRRALQLAGGFIAGSLGGCTSVDQVFDTYSYEKDAPIDGPVAVPWRTLAHDVRRSGYTPYGRVPSTTTTELFADTGRSFGAQPIYVGGTAYFGYDRHFQMGVAGLRTDGGEIDRWLFGETDRLATPTVVGDAVFVTSEGITRALDRRDGSLCWEYHEGTGRPTASPTVNKETLYVTGERVFALTARTGEVRWATNRLNTNLRGTATTADGVFATGGSEEGGVVYRFDPETGREQWATTTSGVVSVPPVLGELVYVVEVPGRLRALDPSDGTAVWSYELDSRSSAPPAVANGTVYLVGTNGNTLYALDALTGAKRWEYLFGARSAVGPTVAGDTVYLPTSRADGGVIRELDADAGTVRGAHELPMAPTSPLVIGVDVALISVGTRFLGSQLYRLRRPPPE